MIFFMPETAYYGDRPDLHALPANISLNQSATTPEKLQENAISSPRSETKATQNSKAASESVESESAVAEVIPKSYIQNLKVWSKDTVNPDVRLKAAFLRPLVLFA